MKSYTSYRRSIVLVLFISLSLISCKEENHESKAMDVQEAELPPYAPSVNEEANIEMVSSFITALMTNDIETANGMVTDDFMDHGPGAKDSATIDQMQMRWATNTLERSNQDPGIFAANSLQVNEGPFAGEWVHLWGNYTAERNGSDFKYNVPWHRVFILEDGKISFSQVWYDSLGTALEIGAVVPAESTD